MKRETCELGYLAVLVATMPGWVEFMVNTDAFDIAPPGGQLYK